jgi:hypothetical protein
VFVDIEVVEVDSEETRFGRLSLHRYSAETGEVGYEIRLDDNFLMASHGSHSERAMADLAYETLMAERANRRDESDAHPDIG